jgi:hypothetical protein
MGRRHKRAGTGVKDHRIAGLLPERNNTAAKNASLLNEHPQGEPALPSLPQSRLACRQMGSFRGRRIFETGLSLLPLH